MSDLASIRIYLFGKFQIKNGDEVIHLPRRKTEALLAFLVLHSDAYSREKLAALLWGDYPDVQARASLRNALAVLRKNFGEGILLNEGNSIRLNRSLAFWADIHEFEEAVNPKAQPEAVSLKSAVDLYRGELLADFYDDWLLEERERFHHLYLDALIRLTHQLRAQSDYESAIEIAHRALAVNPADEQIHQHLMFCYMATGKRQAALEQYHRAQRILAAELALEPTTETKAFYTWIKQTQTETPSFAARITNLPIPISSFIGRKQETREIKDLVVRSRLVTLTGSGGTGKTRLAIQSATDLIDYFKDGVWWVELAKLNDANLVAQEIARTFGIRESTEQPLIESISDYLQARQQLLVIDNCEHLINACAELINQLLSHCPRLHILTTSRESLGIAGETAWRVPPLSMPDKKNPLPVDALQKYECIRLFTERAAEISPGFRLNDANASAIREICERLDGIPLAIELAAARIQTLSPEQIASRLDLRFDLLTHGSRIALPRHQTLRALIAWSFDLLSEPEKILFRRLSIFRGGFTLEAAESVCGGDGLEANQMFDLLNQLVNKSLLTVAAENDAPRFDMLETVHAYAAQKLDESNEKISVLDRYLDFFLALAEKAAPQLRSHQQIVYLKLLDREQDNLRAAVDWCLENRKSEAGLRMGTALWWYWRLREQFPEGIRRLRAIIIDSSQDFELTESYVKVLNGAGWLELWAGDANKGYDFSKRALYLAQRLGNKDETAWALCTLGDLPTANQSHDTRISLLNQAVALWRETNNEWALGVGFNALGEEAREAGDYVKARAYYEDSLMWRTSCGDIRGIALSNENLGYVFLREKDWKQAAIHLLEDLRLNLQLGARLTMLKQCLIGLAEIAINVGQPTLAVHLWDTVQDLLAISHETHMSPDWDEYLRIQSIIRTIAEDENVKSEIEKQGRLNADQAINLALAMKVS